MHVDKTLSSSATLHWRSPTVSEAERRPYDLIINQRNCFCIEVRPQWTQRFLCRNCDPGLISTTDMAVVNHRHSATEGRHITVQFLRTAETFGPVNTAVWLKVSAGKTILILLMMILTQGNHSCSLKAESRHVFWIAPIKILLLKMGINDKLNQIGLFFFSLMGLKAAYPCIIFLLWGSTAGSTQSNALLPSSVIPLCPHLFFYSPKPFLLLASLGVFFTDYET